MIAKSRVYTIIEMVRRLARAYSWESFNMSHKHRATRLFSVLTIISLSACQSSAFGGLGAPAAAAFHNSANLHRSALETFAGSKGDKLLYVSQYRGAVTVLSYPEGKQIGSLSGFQLPTGLCSDKHGHVFVVDSQLQEIFEYMHGGTSAVATLDDTGNYPNGCAVDGHTGNLAVAGGGFASANIAVYPKGSGSPTVYVDGNDNEFYYCTYDNKGNLFASGSIGSTFSLAVLRKGGEKISDIGLHGVNPGGAIQWDGKHLALESPAGNSRSRGPITIYQLDVSGSSASIVNTIELQDKADRNPAYGVQFWIANGTIASPEMIRRNIGLWRYPSGGKNWKTIRFPARYARLVGLTISG